MESGNQDTSRFVLKNRDIQIKSGSVGSYHHLFPDKKIVNLSGSGFFSTKVKKKNQEFRINLEVVHPWVVRLDVQIKSVSIVEFVFVSFIVP